MGTTYPTITITNTLKTSIVVYDAFQNDEADKSITNFFGTLTSITTIKAGETGTFTPIHGPISTYIIYDEGYTPISRIFSLGIKADSVTITEDDVAVMTATEAFIKLMQDSPENDEVKAFNAIIKDGKGTAKKVNDFFKGTSDYKSVTFVTYMLAVVSLARTPQTKNKPPQDQVYKLSTLVNYMGFNWPDSIPDVEIAHFKCTENDKAIMIGGDLEISDVTFADGVLSHIKTFIPDPTIHFGVEFIYNGGLGTGMTCLKFSLDKVCIPIGDSKTFDIDKPTMLLSLNPLFKFVVFEIKAEIPFNIFNSPTIDADVAMTIDNVEAEVGVVLKGNKTSLLTPPIVKGLHFDTFGVGLGLIFEPPGFAIGLEGTFHIGNKGEVPLTDDNFAIVCEMEEEVPNPLYFAFYVPKLDLSEVITLFTNSSIDLDFPVSFQQLAFRWAENPMEPVTLPDGSLAPMGYGFSGYMDLFGLELYGYLQIDLNNGVQGTITMSPLHMGPVLQLTGDGKGVSIKVDKSGNPIPINVIPKTKADKKTIKDATEKQIIVAGGPEMSVSTSSSPYFSIDAQISLFELINEKIDAKIANNGISFELDYGAILTSKLKCVLKDYHNFTGDFSYKLDKNIPLPSIGGVSLGSIPLDVGCEAGMAITTSTSDLTFEVHGSFEFEGLKRTIGPFNADVHIKQISDILEAIGRNLVNNAEEIFKDLISDASKWAKFVKNEVIAGVKDVGKVLKDGFHKSAEEATTILKGAGYTATEIGGYLKEGFGLGADAVYGLLKKVYPVDVVEKALSSIFSGIHVDIQTPPPHADTNPHVDTPAGPHVDSCTPPHGDTHAHVDTPSGPHADTSVPPHGDKGSGWLHWDTPSGPHADSSVPPHGDTNPHVDTPAGPHVDTCTPPHGDTHAHIDTPSGPHIDIN